LTVDQLLRDSPLRPADKRLLLAHVLGVSREFLVAHPEQAVSPTHHERFDTLAQQYLAGVPLAYLLGNQPFFGEDFLVSPAVLIPRPDTETLVEYVLAHFADLPSLRVVDLGTGSGCIAVTLARLRPSWTVVAIDQSHAALAIAAENARRQHVTVQLLHGNWLTGIHGPFDIIVSNPPYIPADDAHLKQLTHEPRTALTDEEDGLRHLTDIADQSRDHLSHGGSLVLEHGYDQGPLVRRLLSQRGYLDIQTQTDSQGHDRVTCGRWAPSV
jgi:release factor glutamine methyltransferase